LVAFAVLVTDKTKIETQNEKVMELFYHFFVLGFAAYVGAHLSILRAARKGLRGAICG
jgi:hypothetical protein